VKGLFRIILIDKIEVLQTVLAGPELRDLAIVNPVDIDNDQALLCLPSSSLSHSFGFFCRLNSPTIWWGDFPLTYNAKLHILYSSKRKFLSKKYIKGAGT
jgi:hypothetical protein